MIALGPFPSEAPYPKPSAKTVMLTIDLTTEVCEEALANEDVSLLVAYHPPVNCCDDGICRVTAYYP